MSLALYEAQQVRELERLAIANRGVSSVELMRLAAAAAWQQARRRWPTARRVVVLCGSGNNGGDGYEIAVLARAAGCEVSCHAVGAQPASGDAALARSRWGEPVPDYADGALDGAELIVDAIFGIGLNRAPQGAAATAIRAIAARPADTPVLAVDLPSGLDADTGCTFDPIVRADLTVSFIGRKLGLYVGAGPDVAGERVFAALGPFDDGSVPCAADLLEADDLRALLPRRKRTAHKGDHGHVLLAGGGEGMPGALLLAGRAALRAGAGLVTLVTRAAHVGLLTAAQPELMTHGIDSPEADPHKAPGPVAAALKRASVLAIGPGLGQDAWAQALWAALKEAELPQVVDADALNLLAQQPAQNPRRVLTPHPGEAARLLATDSPGIQDNRVAAVRALRARYGGIAVLKGAGTLVLGVRLGVCPYGNPGMGVGGMGDALTGTIAGLLAQGLAPEAAARAGVLAHALAGDSAAQQGQRGLLPSDLIDNLRAVLNP